MLYLVPLGVLFLVNLVLRLFRSKENPLHSGLPGPAWPRISR
jgi:hypothetical protein